LHQKSIVRRTLLLFLFIALSCQVSWAQNITTSTENKTSRHQQLELRHDNDFFNFTDRYYTSGSFIEYRYRLDQGEYEEHPEQISFLLQHEIYTPSNILTSDITEMDRPYAGFLGISSGWSKVVNTEFLQTKVLIGVSGPISGAADFQGLFHSAGGISTPPWDNQINNSFHINFYVDYIKEWLLYAGSLRLYVATNPSFAVGTKDVYVQQETAIYFGKRNAMPSSVAYNQLGSLDNELFLKLRANYRFVQHDAMLEGNLVRDNSPFLVSSKDSVLFLGADVIYRWGKNDFKLAYTYHTPKFFRTQDPHIYMGVTVARRL